MKKYFKISVNLIISLALFIILFSSIEKPQKVKTSKQITTKNVQSKKRISTNNSSKQQIARRGHHRHRHHRHRHRGRGFYFRFDVGPPARYYYRQPYYEYVRVYFEISDNKHERVTEVQIGDKIIYLNSPTRNRRYYFSLRPGYYTIRWRVVNETFEEPEYRNYKETLKVYRGSDPIFVTIKGSKIYID